MRIMVAAAVACLSVVGLSVAGDVKAAIKTDISIPAGGLGPALQSLSEERRIHVIFVNEDVSRLITQGASGSLTVDEVLKQLLNGTGLTYQYIDDETVSIVPLATAPANSTKNSMTRDGNAFKVAQAAPSESQSSRKADSPSGESDSSSVRLEEVIVSLSEILCLRHNMTDRSHYADQTQTVRQGGIYP